MELLLFLGWRTRRYAHNESFDLGFTFHIAETQWTALPPPQDYEPTLLRGEAWHSRDISSDPKDQALMDDDHTFVEAEELDIDTNNRFEPRWRVRCRCHSDHPSSQDQLHRLADLRACLYLKTAVNTSTAKDFVVARKFMDQNPVRRRQAIQSVSRKRKGWLAKFFELYPARIPNPQFTQRALTKANLQMRSSYSRVMTIGSCGASYRFLPIEREI